MLIKENQIPVFTQMCAEGGKGKLQLHKMSDTYEKPAHLRTFAVAELEPGASVGYHIHMGESETYYILSGSGIYNDNGTLMPIAAGDVTFTPHGAGHGLENTGDTVMRFIPLIILD